RAAERRQDEQPALGAAEFGGVGGVLQAVQVSFGEGVEAKQERHLRDVGEAGEVAVVGARAGARRIVAIMFGMWGRAGNGLRNGSLRRRRWSAGTGLLHPVRPAGIG